MSLSPPGGARPWFQSQPSSLQTRPSCPHLHPPSGGGPQLTTHSGARACVTPPSLAMLYGRETAHPRHNTFFLHCTHSLSAPNLYLGCAFHSLLLVVSKSHPRVNKCLWGLPRATDPHPSLPQGTTQSPRPGSNIWRHPALQEMATPSGILAWRILWTEAAGRLQSVESQRVGHD